MKTKTANKARTKTGDAVNKPAPQDRAGTSGAHGEKTRGAARDWRCRPPGRSVIPVRHSLCASAGASYAAGERRPLGSPESIAGDAAITCERPRLLRRLANRPKLGNMMLVNGDVLACGPLGQCFRNADVVVSTLITSACTRFRRTVTCSDSRKYWRRLPEGRRATNRRRRSEKRQSQHEKEDGCQISKSETSCASSQVAQK